ncbi:MAG: carboxypeptidase-like regulatory domain-containing protein [Nitrososphaeria archaeon]
MPSQGVSITASFLPATVQVTVQVVDQFGNPVPNATVTITGGPLVSPISATTNSSGQVTPNLQPGYTYNFSASASGYIEGGTSTYISGPTTVTIHITETATLTVSATQGGSVTVYVSPDNSTWSQVGTVSAGQSNSWAVPVGAYVKLQANPSSGYQFSNWSGVP